jgi:L-aspartate oxidase
MMPRPLLSEALRGHGALLRDANGDRFVDELLPRDEVSRAETRVMLEQDTDHCWLDATGLPNFDQRFPTIASELRAVGLDPSRDWLPIAPAAHYLCGGIVTDLDGATDLAGLWASGEVACSGVHGANRLASNSLLEGMVFAFRVVEAIERGKGEAESTGAMRAVLDGRTPSAVIGGERLVSGVPTGTRPGAGEAAPDSAVARDQLQRSMTRNAGVLRTADSLAEARSLAIMTQAAMQDPRSAAAAEAHNLASVAVGMVAAALAREESRGAHTRSDHPDRDDQRFGVRFVLGGQTRQAGAR